MAVATRHAALPAGFIPPPSSPEEDLAALGVEPSQGSVPAAAAPSARAAPAAQPAAAHAPGPAAAAFEQTDAPGGQLPRPPLPKPAAKKRGGLRDDLVCAPLRPACSGHASYSVFSSACLQHPSNQFGLIEFSSRIPISMFLNNSRHAPDTYPRI